MNAHRPDTLTHVTLEWPARIRFIIVAVLSLFVLGRTLPDAVRLWIPLGIFNYTTDLNAVVESAPPAAPPGTDRLVPGDRVRIDRISPFDRKPGIVRNGYTRENVNRYLPIERGGAEQVVHLRSQREPIPLTAVSMLRIIVLIVSVAFGALIVLIKPNVATYAFFVFCLGGDYPTTYMDNLLPVPWREITIWIGDTIRGGAPMALLLFGICLLIEKERWERIWALGLGICGIALGTSFALGDWFVTFAAHPAANFDAINKQAVSVTSALTAVAFLFALLRTRGVQRQRTAWIVVSFAFAAIAKLVSETLYPEHINFIENSALLTTSIIPILVVWKAVLNRQFFDVDFVVNRGMVFTAAAFTVVVVIGVAEEILAYVFVNNVDFAYVVLNAITLVIGITFGYISDFFKRLVDRFIFRDRMAQQVALEHIASTVLDAESIESVYDILLRNASDALDLSFAGIFFRRDNGEFTLGRDYQWPPECQVVLGADSELTRLVTQTRGALGFDGKKSSLITRAFPAERLTFVAPLLVDRMVSALVIYGHSITGVDLDPDERVLLVRVVSNASVAINAIELDRYRTAAAALAPAVTPG